MAKVRMMGRSIPSGGGRRVTLSERGEVVASVWAPTSREALQEALTLESSRCNASTGRVFAHPVTSRQ